jgi:glycine cleavage system transcriptional repressor
MGQMRLLRTITLRGADHPGLIAQLTEVLMTFDANIVRLNAETIPNQDEKEYLINLSVSIPQSRSDACLACSYKSTQIDS